MAHIATAEFIELFKDYPLKSQDDKKDPLVIAKVFDTFGSATWFLTELEDIKHEQLGIPRIERDLYFTQQPLCQLVDF